MTEENAPVEPVPDVWNVGRDRNPYLHNIFVLLACDPDESERSFDSQRKFAGTQVKRGGKVVNGYEVKEIDVTGADEMAAQAPKFVASRLLFHSSHRVDHKTFSDAIAAVECHKLPKPTDQLPLAVRDLTELHALLPEPDEVLPDDESRLSKARFSEILQPSARDEQIFDL